METIVCIPIVTHIPVSRKILSEEHTQITCPFSIRKYRSPVRFLYRLGYSLRDLHFKALFGEMQDFFIAFVCLRHRHQTQNSPPEILAKIVKRFVKVC